VLAKGAQHFDVLLGGHAAFDDPDVHRPVNSLMSSMGDLSNSTRSISSRSARRCRAATCGSRTAVRAHVRSSAFRPLPRPLRASDPQHPVVRLHGVPPYRDASPPGSRSLSLDVRPDRLGVVLPLAVRHSVADPLDDNAARGQMAAAASCCVMAVPPSPSSDSTAIRVPAAALEPESPLWSPRGAHATAASTQRLRSMKSRVRGVHRRSGNSTGRSRRHSEATPAPAARRPPLFSQTDRSDALHEQHLDIRLVAASSSLSLSTTMPSITGIVQALVTVPLTLTDRAACPRRRSWIAEPRDVIRCVRRSRMVWPAAAHVGPSRTKSPCSFAPPH